MKWISILIGITLLFISCESAINITQPTILIKSDKPSVSDSISLTIIEFAEIDGIRQNPDFFKWDILDSNNDTVYSDYQNNPTTTWIPESSGYFIISVIIGYDKNKTIKTLREIDIEESPKSLQQKLVGKWAGIATSRFGNWKITISFDSIGHYKGKAYDVSDPDYSPISLFYYGRYDYEITYGGNWNQKESSEDIPCTRFLISDTSENLGFGLLSIGYEYKPFYEPYYAECYVNFDIINLAFSNGNQSLYFELINHGSTETDWFIKYDLTRIDD